jgi:hypothetical protein
MNEKLKWIIPTVIAVLLAMGLAFTLYLHLTMKEKNNITKLTLKYSTGKNSPLKSAVNIEAYLVENDSTCYLVIPGKGTQNAFKYEKINENTSEPGALITDKVIELSGYAIDTSVKQINGYFNNCGIYQNCEWTLGGGILVCRPYVYGSDNGNIVRQYQPINIKTCGGSSIPAGTELTQGFGASVIPLKKA